MDEEGASEKVTAELERRIKRKSKNVRVSEEELTAEMKKELEREKQKKPNGTLDNESEIMEVAPEGELAVARDEDGNGNAVRKRKKKEKKNKSDGFEMGNAKEVESNQIKTLPEGDGIFGLGSSKEASQEKKNKKAKRKHEDGDFEKEGGKDGTDKENNEVEVMENVEKKRKKKKKMSKDDNQWQDPLNEAKHDEGDLSSLQKEFVPDNVECNIQLTDHVENAMKEPEKKKKKKKERESFKDDPRSQKDSVDKDVNGPAPTDEAEINEAAHANKRKKRKAKSAENSDDDTRDNQVENAKDGKQRKKEVVEEGPDDPTPSKSNKKVRFSGKDDVFTLPCDSNTEKGTDEEENLLRGKRFTPEEDEIVKEAVSTFILDHDLGEEGLDMVLNSRKHPELKGCWREIGSAIPYRPYTAVYYRAQNLFRRSENRKWTQEEYDMILKYQEEHGNEWKELADELGKHRFHVKDTWRRIKLRNMNSGHWSQEEYQKFFDLVNKDLQLKVTEEKRSKHGMLRDNICWTEISDQLSTRSQANCCKKWYKQLTSPMVQDGVWADTDDYRLLGELYSLDATCIEDVDWDNLVDGRAGNLCRKRWNQMSLHIGRHGRKSFAEQVEILAQRYCPHLLEARETWDSKPRVP